MWNEMELESNIISNVSACVFFSLYNLCGGRHTNGWRIFRHTFVCVCVCVFMNWWRKKMTKKNNSFWWASFYKSHSISCCANTFIIKFFFLAQFIVAHFGFRSSRKVHLFVKSIVMEVCLEGIAIDLWTTRNAHKNIFRSRKRTSFVISVCLQ